MFFFVENHSLVSRETVIINKNKNNELLPEYQGTRGVYAE